VLKTRAYLLQYKLFVFINEYNSVQDILTEKLDFPSVSDNKSCVPLSIFLNLYSPKHRGMQNATPQVVENMQVVYFLHLCV